MTYLHYLEQVVDTPAINYHEYVLNRQRQEKFVKSKFFELEAVQETWAELSNLETELYEKEKNIRRNTVRIVSLSSKVELSSDKNSLAVLYSRMKTVKEKYALLKQENSFSVDNRKAQELENDEPSILSESPTDSGMLSSGANSDSDVSGVDFLLSMAGMFSSIRTRNRKVRQRRYS
ncbi:MAG: hypothetical protein DCF25_17705 [Leptolyngbya foveolarum]|uniref:Uncharacterized protein n=1 Tax=Leptolyngbya foveolarum TaxID=47253 RepID=A0A2W4VJP8_9CYAN|nr:MAG: hypothetical protein DCF25_17705 [Leptolyngbya foveolarum]